MQERGGGRGPPSSLGSVGGSHAEGETLRSGVETLPLPPRRLEEELPRPIRSVEGVTGETV